MNITDYDVKRFEQMVCPKCESIGTPHLAYGKFHISYGACDTVYPERLILSCSTCGYEEWMRPADSPREEPAQPTFWTKERVPFWRRR